MYTVKIRINSATDGKPYNYIEDSTRQMELDELIACISWGGNGLQCGYTGSHLSYMMWFHLVEIAGLPQYYSSPSSTRRWFKIENISYEEHAMIESLLGPRCLPIVYDHDYDIWVEHGKAPCVRLESEVR